MEELSMGLGSCKNVGLLRAEKWKVLWACAHTYTHSKDGVIFEVFSCTAIILSLPLSTPSLCTHTLPVHRAPIRPLDHGKPRRRSLFIMDSSRKLEDWNQMGSLTQNRCSLCRERLEKRNAAGWLQKCRDFTRYLVVLQECEDGCQQPIKGGLITSFQL